MDSDPELEMSPLCGPIKSGNRSVEVHIYRLVGESGWILEVVDEHDNSTVWAGIEGSVVCNSPTG